MELQQRLVELLVAGGADLPGIGGEQQGRWDRWGE
jgi:hypothetical protein